MHIYVYICTYMYTYDSLGIPAACMKEKKCSHDTNVHLNKNAFHTSLRGPMARGEWAAPLDFLSEWAAPLDFLRPVQFVPIYSEGHRGL